MKAVVFKDTRQVVVEEVEDPRLQQPTDAVLRVTSAAICGSDLHMYDGRSSVESGTVFGHEIMGVIEEAGAAVQWLKPGDRVVLPFNISCGTCFNCTQGFTNACLTMNDEPGAAYGYVGMGPYRGGQAEFVRVPFADFNALKLPGKPHDKFEDDFLMLADIFPTGYHACEMALVKPGSTVAIYGAGPVGLLAAHSAFIKGAAQVFVVDRSKERLAIAKKYGAVPINWEDGDPVDQIREFRRSNPLVMESLRPGEEKLLGVSCGIDAVGYQALSLEPGEEENPAAVIESLVEIANAGAALGIIGAYSAEDPGSSDPKARSGVLELPFGMIWQKGLQIGTGQCPVKKYNAYLRDLIIAGQARPAEIVSHRINLEEAADGYRYFDFRGVGEGKKYTKVVLKISE